MGVLSGTLRIGMMMRRQTTINLVKAVTQVLLIRVRIKLKIEGSLSSFQLFLTDTRLQRTLLKMLAGQL